MFKTVYTAFFLAALVPTAFAQEASPYELPGDSLFPEGVAYDDRSGMIFVGSATQGTILQVNAETGEVTTLVEGGQRESFTTLGIKVDRQNRLWVAGGNSGEIYAYDVETGEEVVSLATPEAEATFLNDLVVSATGDVYVTDSSRPVLFKVAAEAEEAESWLDFTGTAFEYDEGTNANGIAITPDGSYLLVVQMDAGNLYRVDVESKEVVQVDLGGEALTGADGLVLEGQTLYVVLQPSNEVAVVTLAEDLASGVIERRVSNPPFHAPATAALVNDSLLVVNTQFDRMQGEEGPSLPFTISSIPLSVLAGDAE